MAVNIPMPGIDRGGLFEGLVHGNQAKFQRNQLEQQWQQHLQDLAVRQIQQEIQQKQQQRLAEQFELQKELHPYQLQAEQQKLSEGPARRSLLEAKIKSEEEKARAIQKYGSQRPTAAIQEADSLFDRDDPRWGQYVLNKSKQYMPSQQEMVEEEKLKETPEFAQIAAHLENAIPMNNLAAGTQNLYRKAMNEELTQIDKAKQVKHAISQARELTKNNPDLYRKAINIIADPEKSPGLTEKSLTAFLPKKEVEAFTTAHKLYSDILTKQAQLNGMSRSVYALKLQQQAKAQVKNPDETNEQIFKNIENEIAPQLAREKALLYAMKHNQYLPYTKKYAFESENTNEIPDKIHSSTEMGMMKGIINGQEVDVSPDDRDDFIEAGGEIL